MSVLFPDYHTVRSINQNRLPCQLPCFFMRLGMGLLVQLIDTLPFSQKRSCQLVRILPRQEFVPTRSLMRPSWWNIFVVDLTSTSLTFMRPGRGGTSGGSLRSSRQAVACHPFTRSWATMPPEVPPLPGLWRNGGTARFHARVTV